MATILENIGKVAENSEGEKEISQETIEDFALKVKEQLEAEKYTCFGKEIDIPHLSQAASQITGSSFYNPENESIQDFLERNSGWQSTWVTMLSTTTTSIIDAESQQILKTAFPASGYPGDPTEVILELINMVKVEISDFVSDVNALIQKYLLKIMESAGKIITAITLFLQSGFTAIRQFINDLVEQFKIIFEPEGNKFLNKLEKALKEKKDEIKLKIKSIIFPSIPELPILNLDLSIEGILILLKFNINFPEINLPSLASIMPPGIGHIFFSIIIGLVEFILSLPLAIIEIGAAIVGYVLSLDFAGLLSYLQGIVLEIFLKILELIPNIEKTAVFLASFFAFVEIVGTLFIIVVVGHMIGQGLILKGFADFALAL